MRLWLIAGITVAGVVIGWLARGFLDSDPTQPIPVTPASADSATPATSLQRAETPLEFLRRIEHESPGERLRAIQAFAVEHGHTFYSLLALAAANAELGQYAEAIQLLLDAAVAVEDAAQQSELERALDLMTEDRARMLIAANRFDDVDRMYEQITLALPELSAYFMALGELRLRLGNVDGAMMVLAQIQNDAALGARARELMTQAEASEAVEAGIGEQLPLRVAGSQFVVNARLDDDAAVALLIDTGAAMTIIKADTLARLGYPLSGRRELFATAGGVVEAPVVTLSSLALGSSAVQRLPVGAMSFDMPGGIDGLLGMNYLRHFEFRIDQDEGVLYLEAPRR